MKVILEWNADSENMLDQMNAAKMAVNSFIKVGDFWGLTVNGSYFGVKRNKDSLRVYVQAERNEG